MLSPVLVIQIHHCHWFSVLYVLWVTWWLEAYQYLPVPDLIASATLSVSSSYPQQPNKALLITTTPLNPSLGFTLRCSLHSVQHGCRLQRIHKQRERHHSSAQVHHLPWAGLCPSSRSVHGVGSCVLHCSYCTSWHQYGCHGQRHRSLLITYLPVHVCPTGCCQGQLNWSVRKLLWVCMQ